VRPSTAFAFAALIGGLGWGLGAWKARTPRGGLLIFSAGRLAAEITVQPRAAAAERAAARLLATALAQAAGAPDQPFSIRSAGPNAPGRRIQFRLEPGGSFEASVGYTVTARDVTIHATRADELPAAAAWFLERTLAARWFAPGPRGTEIETRRELRLPAGRARHELHFLSRTILLQNHPTLRDWQRANKLVTRFEHGHTAARLVTPADIQRAPEMAPWVNGRRYKPTSSEDSAWQPDLTAPATVRHVRARLTEQLRAHPSTSAVVFGQNDSWRWDQSERTLTAIGAPRYFRGYPVYSNLLFSFLNELAKGLAPEFPEQLISTYAYQWTEDTPNFPVHANVLPFLTADRSQWFDPEFRRGDEQLMRRWAQAGPRFFALYDYYYGAPFFVPRPTLYAVRDSIPFAAAAGARAFFAEAYANWALDGPKPWLAAQLLWDPRADSAALLDEYFSRYWKEAAGPMRAFFAACDRQWLTQPRPGYWDKFYKDDHQAILFPPAVRAELRAHLDHAARLARSPVVQARLAETRAAFAVAEAFCRHAELGAELSRLLLEVSATADAIEAALAAFSRARTELVAQHAALRRSFPFALSSELLPEYLRADPRPRALRRLAGLGRTGPADPALLASVFADRAPTVAELNSSGVELLGDRGLQTVHRKNVHPFVALDWNEPGGPWVGKGEPFETRKIELAALRAEESAAGNATPVPSLQSVSPGPQLSNLNSQLPRSLRYSGVNQEGLYQTVPAQPGALYRATVRVRGKVSPGNQTFLLLTFADARGRNVDGGHIDRLPLGEWPEWTTLETIVRAPAGAVWLGFGLRALYQVNDDYVEFAEPSLQQLNAPEPTATARPLAPPPRRAPQPSAGGASRSPAITTS
jgi:hypothetical protein